MLDKMRSGNCVRSVCEHVFVWTDRSRFADRAFFAGFIAGDGSFSIRENNSGASWCCGLQVKLRADDTPLLTALRAWTSAGQLSADPARAGSRPQTAWTVASQAGCVNVGNMLGDVPVLGKKSLEFEIWQEAVEVWVARGGADPALADLGGALREMRRDRSPVPCAVSISDSYLAAFLAGFASAEAHFGASEGSPSFVINLRTDDGPLLELFQTRFALGHLADVKPAGRSLAALSWRVGRLADMRRLVELFDRYPPRGRAAGVYAAWRELVQLETRTGGARRALAAEVSRRRSFRPELGEFTTPERRERSQARCLEALHSWASTLEGSGTSGEYDEWRRTVAPAAPSRNTVATAFGSWRAALVAAGLSCDRAQPPDRHAKVRATRSPARAVQLVKRRNLVLDAVTACVADLGREPRAGEFLRWRLHEAPESPCQMTLYRAFPQGFAEVLVELRARSARQLRVQLDRLHGRQGLRYRAAFLGRLRVLLEVVVVDSGH
jgi:hypothetical protein